MNEFEWRRQMRNLRQPLVPQRNLWATIDDALEGSARQTVAEARRNTSPPMSGRRRHWLAATGVAASLLLAAGIGWQALQLSGPATIATSTTAHDWKPADPRLAGAAIELGAARMELQLAIQQAPDSPSLRRLLGRTELQQTQLRHRVNQAG
ncbi:MAG TPA: hypothetical protein VIL60_06790 [Rhodanobacter sp.]